MTQAVHRRARGVVVRQDDDVVIFRGGWALLSFDVAGYTREIPFKFINIVIILPAGIIRFDTKLQPSLAHAPSGDRCGTFLTHAVHSSRYLLSNMFCIAWGGREEEVGTAALTHHQLQPLTPHWISPHPSNTWAPLSLRLHCILWTLSCQDHSSRQP